MTSPTNDIVDDGVVAPPSGGGASSSPESPTKDAISRATSYASSVSASTLTEMSDGEVEKLNADVHSEQLSDLEVNLMVEKPLFDEEVEREGCRKILEALSEEEKECLADRNHVLRHFRAEKGDIESATKKLKQTLAWRKEFEVEKIKHCFDEGGDEELRSILSRENETGKVYARGYDKEGRAILYLTPGMENTKDEIDQMRHLVYQMERAIACTAKKSGKEKINIIINFKGFKIRNAPPMSTTRYTVDILQLHYCERLHRSYVCNPPMVFRTFWAMVSPFLDSVTKEKIIFVHGEPGKKILEERFDLSKMEACAGGPAEGVLEFDTKQYMSSPFDTTFDEELN